MTRKEKAKRDNETRPDAKTYLRQYIYASLAINGGIDELTSLRALAEKVTSSISGQPKGSGRSREEIICKMVDLEKELDEKIDRMVELRIKIEKEISLVADQRYRSILQMRYINGWTLEKIAVETGYSWRQVNRIHGQALERFRKDVIECHIDPVI